MSSVPYSRNANWPQKIRTAVGLVLFGAFTVGAVVAQMPQSTQSNTSEGAARHINDETASDLLRQGLGHWHWKINTKVLAAQSYFDQGLRLYYAFEYVESVRAFREAEQIDPTCVMCFWGEAVALGPNLNAPMDSTAEHQAIAAAEHGRLLVAGSESRSVSPRERGWMDAIVTRYASDAQHSRAERDSAYAIAMKAIAVKFRDDVDALTLAAEAVMALSPGNYWTNDGSARPGTDQLIRWLERAVKLAPSHPGACQLYVYAVGTTHPERAVRCAKRLASMTPVENYYVSARNLQVLTIAAVMTGSSATALSSSARITTTVAPDVARKTPALEEMLAVPVQTLVALGRWEEVLKTPLPPPDLRVAIHHFWYARGMAFAATRSTLDAHAMIDSLRSAIDSRTAGETPMTLEIAANMVEGELALRSGNAARAVDLLTEATTLEDGLPYARLLTSYHPVRHLLGKALLAAGQAQAAEQVYLADLRRYPENGWSLRGLADALLAQKLPTEARAIERRFKRAWRTADITITSSHY